MTVATLRSLAHHLSLPHERARLTSSSFSVFFFSLFHLSFLFSIIFLYSDVFCVLGSSVDWGSNSWQRLCGWIMVSQAAFWPLETGFYTHTHTHTLIKQWMQKSLKMIQNLWTHRKHSNIHGDQYPWALENHETVSLETIQTGFELHKLKTWNVYKACRNPWYSRWVCKR